MTSETGLEVPPTTPVQLDKDAYMAITHTVSSCEDVGMEVTPQICGFFDQELLTHLTHRR